MLLTRFAPASILVDDDLNVVYFHGETSRYLEHAHGTASLNLQKICRAGLLVELSPAIHEARKNQRPVARFDVRAEMPGSERELSFEVIPVKLPRIESSYFLILFDQPSARRPEPEPVGLLVRLWKSLFGAGSALETETDHRIASLQREVDATRDYLQATVEEHEATKEEMKSAHEEALSSNEEFLSTNEELETAKEELQSANEELGITNQELRTRNRELDDLNHELRQSRSYLDAIVETLRESLLVLDGNLRVQKANHQFYETFQVRPEETLGRYLYELGEGQWDIDALRTLLSGVIPHDRVLRDYEVTHTFPTIGEKTMLLNALRLAGNERRDEMILLAIEDVTGRQISQRKLLEADRRKNDFLATLAHELRNPLTPIRLGIQLLRQEGNESAVHRLDLMERNIQTLVGIVDDLLDIARIERDHIELRKQPIDLIDIINEAVESSRHFFDERHQKLSILLSSPHIRLMGDHIRLIQVVSNLLSNAAKYTDERGEIVLSVGQVAEEAKITVRDNGIGIPAKLLPQLFEMFFQADASFDRTSAGLGIGLAVTKRLVELHGGRIEGNSEGLGRGSEFIVCLPTMAGAENHDGLLPEHPLRPVEPTTPRRVLIVDDSFDTAEAMAEAARLWGHQAQVANDGSSALDLAVQFRPEIALIDIGLPKMNGYELARRLRQLDSMKMVPLIAISGYGREEDRHAAEQAGFNLHLVKPIDPVRFERLLATLH